MKTEKRRNRSVLARRFEARGYRATPKNGPLRDVSKHTVRPARGLTARGSTSAPPGKQAQRQRQRASVAKVDHLGAVCQIGTSDAAVCRSIVLA